MRNITSTILSISILLASAGALADAPLAKQLDLNTDQAQKVSAIQASHRRTFAAKRGELHREERALRRAKLDNDEASINSLSRSVEKLKRELLAIRTDENVEINKLLTSEQKAKFSSILASRQEMTGSSRDVKEF